MQSYLLEKYIGKHLAKGIISVISISAGLFLFISIILWSPSKIALGWNEKQIFLHVLYQVPWFISNTYPATITIGTLLSMTALSQNNELITLQSAGVTSINFLRMSLLPTITFSIIGFIFIAILGPIGYDLSRTIGTQTEQKPSIWIKKQNYFIFISKIDKNELNNLYFFKVKNNGIKEFYFAKNGNSSSLTSIDFKFYNGHHVTEKKLLQIEKPSLLPSQHLLILLSKSEKRLTITQLYTLMHLENKVGLNMKKIRFQFWRMISQPFTALLLLAIILPALFKAKKTNQILKSTILGLAIILVFYLFNQIAWPITTLLNLPIFFAIMMPPAIILICLKAYLYLSSN